ncbi:MAG: phosphoglycerate kinase [Geminicoccaceae bacterium]
MAGALLSVDFNVPMQDVVTDATCRMSGRDNHSRTGRCRSEGCHFAFRQAEGSVQSSMSLRPVVPVLSKILGGRPVAFANDCVGEEADAAVAGMQPGDVLLLENLRFHAGEEKNFPILPQLWPGMATSPVNDAFSCSHRAHASVVGVTADLPACAGRLMQAELEALDSALGNAERPAAALVGGAKVSSKLDVLGQILDKVDRLVIGGGMAYLLGGTGCQGGKISVRARPCRNGRDHHAACEGRESRSSARRCRGGHRFRGECRYPHGRLYRCGRRGDHDPRPSAPIIDRSARRWRIAHALLWNGPMGAFEIRSFRRRHQCRCPQRPRT